MEKIKKKLGFTLIELLAVIIILAIIALIAIPIILNVIEDARISAGKSEAQMILGGINNYCATEDLKYQLDNSYTKICTSEMNKDDVPTMVNLGNAEITSIRYNGTKLTELIIESNNHKFTLCSNGQFAMDDEKCDGNAGVITTGSIKAVILSNFPYLETDGNGCVIENGNNYSYMGGCYLKGGSVSGKDLFYSSVSLVMNMNNDEITKKFFDSNGNFKAQEYETYLNDTMLQQGITQEEIDQLLETLKKNGINTLFEYISVELFGNFITSEKLFAMQPLNNNSLSYSDLSWKIMGINADGTVRLITDENVTTIPWGEANTAENWDESQIKEWLNNSFYNGLKENNIIKEQIFCSETRFDGIFDIKSTCTNNLSKIASKVGVITLDEYQLGFGANSYLGIKESQVTMTPKDNSSIWFLGGISCHDDGYCNGGIGNISPTTMEKVRAIINIQSNVNIIGGNGTFSNPYQI